MPSQGLNGGTPGQQNSVFAIIPDSIGPKMIDAFQSGASKLTVEFDERLSKHSFLDDLYSIFPFKEIDSIGIHVNGRQVDLLLTNLLDTASVYTITVNQIFDCSGNEIQAGFKSIVFKLDSIAPQVHEVLVTSDTTVNVIFNEKVLMTEGSQILIVSHGIKRIEPLSSSTYRIVATSPFSNGPELTLSLSQIGDVAGNIMDSTGFKFRYFQPVAPSLHDLIISELLPDPTPSVGLPEFEFVEIFNRSNYPFNLAGWSITDGSTASFISAENILLPGEYVVVCHNSAVTNFVAQRVIGLSNFPSLNNSSDMVKLVSSSGYTIDSIMYSQQWYHGDEDKLSGGWTLERKNLNDFCRTAENWNASTNVTGGTPGFQNSILEGGADTTGPQLVMIEPIEADIVILHFNELLNVAIPQMQEIVFDEGATVDSLGFFNNKKALFVKTHQVLDTTKTYVVTVGNVFDCPGNLVQSEFRSKTFRMDTIPPSVLETHIVSDSTITITFSERVEDTENFPWIFAIGSAAPKHIQQLTHAIVELTLTTKLENGLAQSVVIKGVSDRAGNVMDSTTINIRYFKPVAPQFKDIIISEIFPDPAPTQGLPEAEYIELFNRSSNPFDLSGWKLTDGSIVATLPSYILLPDSYLIVSAAAHKVQFTQLGEAVGVSTFPSLNNSTDRLHLIDTASQIIDSVHYQLSWYRDPDKDDGGYSLELVNVNDFCKNDLNWKASEAVVGGTPGYQNSVFSNEMDLVGPKFTGVSLINSQQLRLTFNESLYLTTPSEENIQFLPTIPIQSVSLDEPDRTSVSVNLASNLDSLTNYTVTLNDIKDCPGNLIDAGFSALQFKLDNTKPVVDSIRVISLNQIEIVFSEKVHQTTATNTSNYLFELGTATSIELTNARFVKMILNPPLNNGERRSLLIHGVQDLSGNEIDSTVWDVLLFLPSPVLPKDVVITEIFPDPSPAMGLPEAEFVEIYNRSSNPIDLQGWKISDGGNPAILSSKVLLPNEFLVICSSSQKHLFSQNLNLLGLTNFPSLNNGGDLLILKDETGKTIDSLQYDDAWYKDEDKEDGGWTLERIDPNNICAEETNWAASEAPNGGTPGFQNSIEAEMPDLTGPVLFSVFPTDSVTVVANFNEKLSVGAPIDAIVTIVPSVPIAEKHFLDGSLRSMIFRFEQPLQKGILYAVTIETLDCAGNPVQEDANTIQFALPDISIASDVVINEILFNPSSTGVDFVELVNRSEKFLNLRDWKVANVVNDTVRDKKPLSQDDRLIHPGEYIVLTENASVLYSEYPAGIRETFQEVNLPSFPDDEGAVVILDADENIIDRFDYKSDMHSKLLNETEGVSLERISTTELTQNGKNWKSASAHVGYATPGHANSNSFDLVSGVEPVTVQPEIFSPHGQPNFAAINYQFEKGGYVANVKVIDAQGREIKQLASNELLGVDGFLRWDGDDNQGRKANIGTYMIWFQIFDDSGTVKTMRKRVVLAERF